MSQLSKEKSRLVKVMSAGIEYNFELPSGRSRR